MRLLGASVVLTIGFLMLGTLYPASTPQTSETARAMAEAQMESDGDDISPRARSLSPCTPDVPLVDPKAITAANCVAADLDRLQAQNKMALGQQLNVSSESYLEPLEQIKPAEVAVVGFDVAELQRGEEFNFDTPPLTGLLELAGEGMILTATWHADNPETGASADDRRFQDLGELLAGESATAERFWKSYDEKLDLFERLQTGDDGDFAPTAVVFRPFHEANGDWFWWAQGTDTGELRELYGALQDRAAERGVHNIIWAYSANARNRDTILDPLEQLPEKVDLVGVDSYDPVGETGQQASTVDLTGLDQLAAQVPRSAITEVGPHGSIDGDWDPRVVATTASTLQRVPAYAMLWFDDGDGSDGFSGLKQIGSLDGGKAWLEECRDGVCRL